MEWKTAPGSAEAIPNIALETYGSAAGTIPFRMLRIIERGIQILERYSIRRFIENYLESNSTRVALSVVKVVLLVPLDDEPTVRLLANDSVIHIASGEEIVPEWRDLGGPKRHAFVRNRSIFMETIARLRPIE